MRPWYKNLDWFTILIWLGLVCVGLTAIYSATHGPAREFLKDSVQQNFTRQLEWFGVSAAVMGIVLLLPARLIVRLAPLAYLFCLGLLAAAILFGREVNGAKAWVFGLQPGEIGKVGTVLAVTALLASKEARQGSVKHLVGAAVLLLIPVALLAARQRHRDGARVPRARAGDAVLVRRGPAADDGAARGAGRGRLPRDRQPVHGRRLRRGRDARLLRLDALEGHGGDDVRRDGPDGDRGAHGRCSRSCSRTRSRASSPSTTRRASATARASTSSRRRRPSARAGSSGRASRTARRRSSRTSRRTRRTSSSASSARSSASSAPSPC